MILGRTITYLHAEKLSLVRVGWMTKFFVTGDVISFLMQCTGKNALIPSRYKASTAKAKTSQVVVLCRREITTTLARISQLAA